MLFSPVVDGELPLLHDWRVGWLRQDISISSNVKVSSGLTGGGGMGLWSRGAIFISSNCISNDCRVAHDEEKATAVGRAGKYTGRLNISQRCIRVGSLGNATEIIQR